MALPPALAAAAALRPVPLDAAALAGRIDAVDYDLIPGLHPWHTSAEPPLTFTYRFEDAPAADFPWTDVTGIAAWPDTFEAPVVAALAKYAAILNIAFVEAGPGDADLTFYRAAGGLSGGRGRFRYDSAGNWDGSVVLNVVRDLTSPSETDLIVHEIGHALGLKHTGNYDIGGNLPPPPFLPEAEDSRKFSIMSYFDNPDTGLSTDDPMLYDIAALQARFGANLRTATGDDIYTARPDFRLGVIWDAGGQDAISAAGATGAVRISLEAGTFSSLRGRDDLAIAFGVTIEDATGGAGNDTFWGNAAANRIAGEAGGDAILSAGGDDRLSGGEGDDSLAAAAGRDIATGDGGDDFVFGGQGADALYGGDAADSLFGGAGNDTLAGGAGDDRLAGGSGRDTAVFDGDRSDYRIVRGDGDSARVIGRDGADGRDVLFGIERLQFDDGAFTL